MNVVKFHHLAGLCLAVFSLSAVLKAAAAADKRHVVFLVGDDLRHASGTHEFYAGAMLLKKSLATSQIKDKLSCTVVNNWPDDTGVFMNADLIVHFYKGNQAHFMNDNHALVDELAQKGVGQLLLHYAVDPEEVAEPFIKKWTGGVYKTGLSSNPHWDLKAVLEKHPINSGVAQLNLRDEWYVKMEYEHDCALDHGGSLNQDRVHAIMRGRPDAAKGNGKLTKALAKNKKPSDLTVFWAKERADGGRGAGCTGAHFHKNWADDAFRKQVLNAIVWCANIPVPKGGVDSPRVTEDVLNENLDKRKPKFGRLKLSGETKVAAAAKPKPKVKKQRKPKRKAPSKPKDQPPTGSEPGTGLHVRGIHPFFEIEDLHPAGDPELKISAMCFVGDDLYALSFSPNRTDKQPDRDGKLYKISGLIGAKSKAEVRTELLADALYEPAALAVVKEKIYVGEKTRIIRLDDKDGDGSYAKHERTPLLEGLASDNFHVWTIGFEQLQKDGAVYLCGNFSTHIKMGGARIANTQVNSNVRRGSTFTLGPITGKETADSVRLDYIAGGYRTPNGIMVGPENEVYVTDNQGVFNPANKLIRLEQGGFYGHYLLAEGKPAAFQPADVDAGTGISGKRSPVTLYLPQSMHIARSPGQPVLIRNQTGAAASFNGQLFVPDFTSGSIHRANLEQVKGVWQGALFRFSAGAAKADGTGGLTGGPNRMSLGPDNTFYIGQIGAERLWQFNKNHGLQRLQAKSEAPSDFNDFLSARMIPGGIEIAFLKPLHKAVLKRQLFKLEQWTYIPTSSYGGSPVGRTPLLVKSLKALDGGKRVHLQIDGLRDADSRPLLKNNGYTNENMGWVLHLTYNPQLNSKSLLWAGELWYTMIKNLNQKSAADLNAATVEVDRMLDAKDIYAAMCASCHSTDGTLLAGPSLKGLLGKTQIVIRDGKEVEVTVDRAYVDNAIKDPLSEYPKGLVPAMPPLGLSDEQRAALVDFIQRIDGE